MTRPPVRQAQLRHDFTEADYDVAAFSRPPHLFSMFFQMAALCRKPLHSPAQGF
jgi:hypothetical protein